jgi:hypothetical protein
VALRKASTVIFRDLFAFNFNFNFNWDRNTSSLSQGVFVWKSEGRFLLLVKRRICGRPSAGLDNWP